MNRTEFEFLVTTEDGYRIKTNEHHTVGGVITLRPDLIGSRDYVRCPWPADGRPTRGGGNRWDFLTAEEPPMVTISPRWGKLLGAFAGDGGFQGTSAVGIHCDGQDADWIAALMSDYRAIGLNPTTEKVTTWGGQILRRRSVRVASSHFGRFLVALGVGDWREGKPKRLHCVPDVILRSPQDVVSAWLAGFFETDGTVSAPASTVSATSKSEVLARGVHSLLLSVGIVCKLVIRPGKCQNGYVGKYWHLDLSRAACDKFSEAVGFYSSRKSQKLRDLVAKPHSNRYRPMRWQQSIVSVERLELEKAA